MGSYHALACSISVLEHDLEQSPTALLPVVSDFACYMT